MVQIKPSSYILMAISALLTSVTEALPTSGNIAVSQSANLTDAVYLPDRVAFSNTLNRLTTPVIQATSDEITKYTKYAGIAATAYCRTVVPLSLWNCNECIKQVPDGKLITTFSTLVSDTSGFVLRSDEEKVIYLVFRGTNSIRQGIDDIEVLKVNYTPVAGTQVHAGFYASLAEAHPFYFSTVQDQLTAFPDYKVIVTGHSLGAAQATLAGLDLYQRDSRFTKDNLFIHTAGCPRIGDESFAQYVDSTNLTYTRSIHKNDIVPHIPLKSWGFLHAGVEIWSKNDTDTVVCNSRLESDSCSDTEPPLSFNIIDHLSYYGINEGLCL